MLLPIPKQLISFQVLRLTENGAKPGSVYSKFPDALKSGQDHLGVNYQLPNDEKGGQHTKASQCSSGSHTSFPRKSRIAALTAAGSSTVEVWPAPGMTTSCEPGMPS